MLIGDGVAYRCFSLVFVLWLVCCELCAIVCYVRRCVMFVVCRVVLFVCCLHVTVVCCLLFVD